MGQGGRQEPFDRRLWRGHLVIRSSAVTHLTQCRSEQIVGVSSPSRDALNRSQAVRNVSIYAYDGPLAQSACEQRFG